MEEGCTIPFETVPQRRRGAKLLKIHFLKQPRDVKEYFDQQEEIRCEKEKQGTSPRSWHRLSQKEKLACQKEFEEYLEIMANKDNLSDVDDDADAEHEPKNKKQRMTPPLENLGELNDDSLATIFGFISCYKTLQLRMVNRNWDRTIMSSNYLWDQFLRRDFYGSLGKGEIVENMDRKYNEEEYSRKGRDNSSSTISSDQKLTFMTSVSMKEYISLYGMIPALVSLKRQNLEDHPIYEDAIAITLQERSEFKLVIFNASTQVHKLALILSLLNENGYVPSILLDMVKIGRESDHMLIPLSKFCYAVLTGRESELYEQGEITPSYLTNNNQSLRCMKDEEIDTLIQRDMLQDEIAISPNLEDGFVPFVYYNYMEPVFTHREHCSWASDERGWCPVFMNASFRWFCFAEFETHYDPQTSILTVEKTKATTAVT